MSQPSPSRSPFMPIVVSAPFGNYVDLDNSTATLGTFTGKRRGGPLARALRAVDTLRHHPRVGPWASRLGVHDPGIDWLAQRVFRGATTVSNKIVSVHGFDRDEWNHLVDRIDEIQPLAVELDLDPAAGAGRLDTPRDLYERALATGAIVVVKLPPVDYQRTLESAVQAGVTCLHCCADRMVSRAGARLDELKRLSLECIEYVRGQSYGAELIIIGGGGVYQPDDVDDYVRAGADHVALGGKLLNPMYLIAFDALQPIVDRACELLPLPELDDVDLDPNPIRHPSRAEAEDPDAQDDAQA